MPTDTTTGTATSRARQAKRATRKAGKARLALSGPSGSGKTWTALSVAQALGQRVVLVDTEPGDSGQFASSYYSDAFRFDTIEWSPPYDPRDLALTIKELGTIDTSGDGFWPGCKGYEVVIVDSASHFWTGEGGTMEIADGRFTGWKVASPAQQSLVDAILRCEAHVIVCTRAKQAYEVSEVEKNGRTVQQVVKLGLAPIQRADLEYEFQVVGMMDHEHKIEIGKTRCQALAGKQFRADHQGEFAKVYSDWLNAGEVLILQADADLIRDALNTIGGERRAAVKQEWLDEFGHPSYLVEDRLPTAWAWLSAKVGRDPHPFLSEPHDPTDDGPILCSVCMLPEPAHWHVGKDAAQAPVEPPSPPEPVTPTAPEPSAPGEPQAPDPRPSEEGEPTPEHTATVHHLPGVESPESVRHAFIENLRTMTNQEINAELKEAGLSIGGSRDVRITRLANHVLGVG